MATYDENLHVAVDEILSATENRQLQTKSAQTSAEYNLYFAQGALITAQDKLAKVTKKYDYAHEIDVQGVENSNAATNLSATATEASSSVATTVTNAATAAENVQVAATTVAKLAADVGAAFNLASAANFDSDIYKVATQANGLMQTTAYQAEHASLIAMEASAASAEIIAPVMVQETATMKTEVDNLLKTTTAEFAKLEAQRSADHKRVAAARVRERAAEGLLTDAHTGYTAVTETLESSNTLLNYDLQAKLMPAANFNEISIQISFDAYEYPFSPEKDDADFLPIQAPINYYAVFVKSSKKQQFTISKAEVDFSENKERFYAVKPSTNNNLPNSKNKQDAAKQANTESKPCMNLVDYDGSPVEIGQSYVAFIYIELPMEYKRRLNDFSDLLSAPTEHFIPSVQLAVPTELKPAKPVKGRVQSLSFTVATVVEDSVYECILIPANTPPSDHLMTAKAANKKPHSDPSKPIGIYFNMSIAEQVSGANSNTATRVNSGVNDYVVNIPIDVTDNFGNEILPGQSYFAVILASMESSPETNAMYQTQMSDITANPICVIPNQ